jgi:hypothetical protein
VPRIRPARSADRKPDAVDQLRLPEAGKLLEGAGGEPERPLGVIDLNPERLGLDLDDRNEIRILEERGQLGEVDDADPEVGRAQPPISVPTVTAPSLSATRMTSSSMSRMSNPE